MSDRTNDYVEQVIEYGLDFRSRRLYLHWPLEEAEKPGDSISELIVRGLHLLDRGSGPIQLWINTPGGYMTEMFAIYDVIRACQNEVWTVGFGEVCSAGCLLLVAGDKRWATPNCQFMSHVLSGGTDPEGRLHELEFQVAQSRRVHARWAEMMAKHTAHSAKWWSELHLRSAELWLTAEQMAQKQHRIVHTVGTP